MALKKYDRGLYALSGDPVHFGHIEIIVESARRCRELVVLVANNSRKKYVFTLEERVAKVLRALKRRGITNVQVIGDDGLMVDVYLREGCDVVFRGIRNESDEAYEKALAEVNALLLEGVQVEMIKTDDPRLRVISSSMVKEIVGHHGSIERFVPMFVKQDLEERLLGQYLIAITGEIATGKSWVADMLVRRARAHGYDACRVNVDELLRELYEERSRGAEKMRAQMAGAFGADILHRPFIDDVQRFTRINRSVLARRLYDCSPGQEGEPMSDRVRRKLAVAERITKPHVQRLLHAALQKTKGLVVVEWAQLAEMGMGPWMNNNVIVVDSSDRARMIAERAIPPERLAAIASQQLTYGQKCAALLARTEADDNGKVIGFDNVRHDGPSKRASIHSLPHAIADVDALLQRVLALFRELKPARAPVEEGVLSETGGG